MRRRSRTAGSRAEKFSRLLARGPGRRYGKPVARIASPSAPVADTRSRSAPRKAPSPRTAWNVSARRGAWTTATSGRPPAQSPSETAKQGRRCTKLTVPSSGSRNQRGRAEASSRTSSSASIACSGKAARSAATSERSLARSASVTRSRAVLFEAMRAGSRRPKCAIRSSPASRAASRPTARARSRSARASVMGRLSCPIREQEQHELVLEPLEDARVEPAELARVRDQDREDARAQALGLGIPGERRHARDPARLREHAPLGRGAAQALGERALPAHHRQGVAVETRRSRIGGEHALEQRAQGARGGAVLAREPRAVDLAPAARRAAEALERELDGARPGRARALAGDGVAEREEQLVGDAVARVRVDRLQAILERGVELGQHDAARRAARTPDPAR